MSKGVPPMYLAVLLLVARDEPFKSRMELDDDVIICLLSILDAVKADVCLSAAAMSVGAMYLMVAGI